MTLLAGQYCASEPVESGKVPNEFGKGLQEQDAQDGDTEQVTRGHDQRPWPVTVTKTYTAVERARNGAAVSP